MGRDAEGRKAENRSAESRNVPDRETPARAAQGRDLVYQNLFMPRGTSRRLAQTMLTMHAEYGGWELDRLRLYPDGTRRVVLRRPNRPGLPPYLPI
jgi:hypothetical protein